MHYAGYAHPVKISFTCQRIMSTMVPGNIFGLLRIPRMLWLRDFFFLAPIERWARLRHHLQQRAHLGLLEADKRSECTLLTSVHKRRPPWCPPPWCPPPWCTPPIWTPPPFWTLPPLSSSEA